MKKPKHVLLKAIALLAVILIGISAAYFYRLLNHGFLKSDTAEGELQTFGQSICHLAKACKVTNLWDNVSEIDCSKCEDGFGCGDNRNLLSNISKRATWENPLVWNAATGVVINPGRDRVLGTKDDLIHKVACFGQLPIE